MTGFIRANVNLTSFRVVNQESRVLREKWVELRAYGDEDVSSAIWDKKSPAIQVNIFYFVKIKLHHKKSLNIHNT